MTTGTADDHEYALYDEDEGSDVDCVCCGWCLNWFREGKGKDGERQALLPRKKLSDGPANRRRKRGLNKAKSDGNIGGAGMPLRQPVPQEFDNHYVLETLIGVGATSKVYICSRRADGERFACKVINKRKLLLDFPSEGRGLMKQLRREVEILSNVSHPGIVSVKTVLENEQVLIMVMELLSGGELSEYLLEQGPLPEEKAARLMHGVLESVAYMHSEGIVHRDIKAENLLLVGPTGGKHGDSWPRVKLIDFGFASKASMLHGSYLGTGGYLAPEIRQQRQYSQSVDLWSCGIILYLLLSARLPFVTDIAAMPKGQRHLVQPYALTFPESRWASRSPMVKDLIQHLLDTDPVARWSATQALQHPWLSGQAFGTPFESATQDGSRFVPIHRSSSMPFAGQRHGTNNYDSDEEEPEREWSRSFRFHPEVVWGGIAGDLMTSCRESVQRVGVHTHRY